MKKLMNFAVVAIILAFAAMVSGCHTMHGLGEDISAGGKAMSKAAEGNGKSDSKTKKS